MSTRSPLRVVALLLVGAACQFQPRGAEVDATGASDDASIEIDAADPSTDASAIDAMVAIDAAMAIDARIDAMTAIDAAMCPPACSSCRADGTCVIDCGAAQCLSGVTCPPGRPCEVNCVGLRACESGIINCLQATSCDITCNGVDACDAGINCAGDACTVLCMGTAACEDGGVDCTATSCEITCDGNNTCRDHVCCTGSDCDSNECQSTNGGCCDCEGC